MAKSVLISGANNNTIAENLTRYFPLGSYLQFTDTEAKAQRTFRTPGVLSRFYITARWNNLGGTSTVTLRKNGGDGSQTVSIGAGSTGEYQDLTNIDTVAAGDEINVKLVTGTGTTQSITLVQCYLNFLPNDRSLTYSLSTAYPGYASTSNSALYIQLAGDFNTAGTEANAANDINCAGTLKNLFVYIIANTKNGATVIRTRKNAGNGSLNVSIAAAATGVFEDTSNSDTIAVNDDVCYQRDSTASSSGSIQIGMISTEFISTINEFMSNWGSTGGGTTNFDNTGYNGFAGAFSQWTEGWMNANFNVKALLSNLTTVVSANTLDVAATVKIRKNSGAANGSISVTAATTGIFEDTSGTDLFYSTDEGCVELNTNPATAGALTQRCFNIKCKSYNIKDIIGGQTNLIPSLR